MSAFGAALTGFHGSCQWWADGKNEVWRIFWSTHCGKKSTFVWSFSIFICNFSHQRLIFCVAILWLFFFLLNQLSTLYVSHQMYESLLLCKTSVTYPQVLNHSAQLSYKRWHVVSGQKCSSPCSQSQDTGWTHSSPLSNFNCSLTIDH